MPNLFPVGYDSDIPDMSDVATKRPVGYKQGMFFDVKTGDFTRDGQYKLKAANGIEAYEQWCFNCLSTEKGKCPYYSNSFGIDTEPVFKADTRELAESLLTLTITEGLMADPYGRTRHIEDISYEWISSDSVTATIKVIGIYDASIDIIVTIGR